MHHSCECREELLRDAVEALTGLAVGLEKYRKTLSLKQQVVFRGHTYWLKMADSILARGRKI